MRALTVVSILVATSVVASADKPEDMPYDDGDYGYRQWSVNAEARLAPDRPADPYAALDVDKPRQMRGRHYNPSGTARDCSARHDHCIREWMWFFELVRSVEGTISDRTARLCWFTQKTNAEDKRGDCRVTPGEAVAYRTVPATKRMLVKGALVLALRFPEKLPASESDAYLSNWAVGYVNTVDWSTGKVLLVGHEQPYWISAARIAVLRWTPKDGLVILGTRKREELAVKPDETIAPTGDATRSADPWAEVGPDGQPKPVTDSAPLETSTNHRCDADHDHCLRPWTWFVDDEGKTIAAMFKNGKLNKIWKIDDIKPVAAQMAYRTVPARPDAMKVGQRAFVTETDNGTELQAMTRTDWVTGKISEVNGDAGVFKLEKDPKFYKIRLARIAVVQWFPGDKAEKAD